jgi:alginate O-acetyltransferase complex protein AlgI
MVFSSHLFVFTYLPLALAVYWLLPRRVRLLGLTLLSYVFYGWASPAFMGLMLASTVIDYACGRFLASATAERSERLRRATVAVSVVSNLSLLGFFKYFDFAVENLALAAGLLGVPALAVETTLDVVLPLGISFYTFQSMSYTIDVYRRRVAPVRSFVTLAAYVSMFPQLVAGPIVRFNEIADQLERHAHPRESGIARGPDLVLFSRGIAFFVLGLGKKILLANPCGEIADIVFAAGSRGVLEAWLGAVAYAFQIYFDFSGYSEMAIGLGLMLGFVLPRNFDAPYRSRSITEFWQRWHISLSSWLRDYLYIPLGGNRRGRLRTYVNLMLVMLLGGLWHGASWNFVIWGGIHGGLLAIERRRGKRPLYDALPPALQTAATFALVLVGWVFFRAETLSQAVRYLGDMLALGALEPAAALLPGIVLTPYLLATLLAAALFTWGASQARVWSRRLDAPRLATLLLVFVVALVAMEIQGYNPFLYFIF